MGGFANPGRPDREAPDDRSKRVILEVYDELAEGIATSRPDQGRRDLDQPTPAPPTWPGGSLRRPVCPEFALIPPIGGST